MAGLNNKIRTDGLTMFFPKASRDPDNGRRARHLDARTVGRGEGIATAIAG